MTRKMLALGLLLSLVLTGCGKKDADDASAEQTAFTQTMEARFATLDAQLDSLKSQGEMAGDSLKDRIHEDLETIKEQRDRAKDKLGELGSATADQWDAAKSGAVSALDSLDASFDRARARMH